MPIFPADLVISLFCRGMNPSRFSLTIYSTTKPSCKSKFLNICFKFIILFPTFFKSIRMFKQTINYFNMAVVRRGTTFNQVKPISCETNLQQFFAARGRTIKCLIGRILAFGFIYLFSTVNIECKNLMIT